MYRVDKARLGFVPTGIVVRAQFDGQWNDYDIAELSSDSFLVWFRSKTLEDPAFAEKLALVLLGYEYNVLAKTARNWCR